MAGELGSMPYGMPVSEAFTLQNPAAAATTVLVTAAGGAGFMVPTGYAFHPMVLEATSNAALTAGTATFSVTDNAVAIVNGPTGLLSSVAGSTLSNTGVQRLAASPVAAGH